MRVAMNDVDLKVRAAPQVQPDQIFELPQLPRDHRVAGRVGANHATQRREAFQDAEGLEL
jgi:hypothetical protein